MTISYSKFFKAALLGGLLCLPATAHAEWIKLEHEKFTVYSDASKRHSRAALVEMIYADYSLRALTGTPDGRQEAAPLKMIMLEDQGDLAKIYNVMARSNSGRDVAGFYMPTPYEIISLSSNIGSKDRRKFFHSVEITKHEFTHHFQVQYFSDAYPTWFVEGFASYVGAIDTEDDVIKIGWPARERVKGLSRSKWLPLDTLLNVKGYALPRDEVHKVYDLGWLLTHYLMSTAERRPQLAEIIAAYNNDGKVSETEFLGITGKSFDEFQAELRDYFDGKAGYWSLPQPQINETDIKITEMSKGDGEAVTLLTSIGSRSIDKKQYNKIEKKVRALVAKYPDSYLSQKTIATFYALNGPEQKAIEATRNFVEKYPNRADPHFLQGEAFFRSVVKKGISPAEESNLLQLAAASFQKSIDIDDQIYQSQFGLARVHAKQRQSPVKVFQSLKKAHDLAPQVRQITYLIGQNYVNRGEFAKGLNYLNQLAVDPHSGRIGVAARKKYEEGLIRRAKQQ